MSSSVVDSRPQWRRRSHDVNHDDDDNETDDAPLHRLTSQRRQVAVVSSSRTLPVDGRYEAEINQSPPSNRESDEKFSLSESCCLQTW